MGQRGSFPYSCPCLLATWRELARAIRAAKPSDGNNGNILEDVRRARPYTPIACINLWDVLLGTAKKHRSGRISVQAPMPRCALKHTCVHTHTHNHTVPKHGRVATHAQVHTPADPHTALFPPPDTQTHTRAQVHTDTHIHPSVRLSIYLSVHRPLSPNHRTYAHRPPPRPRRASGAVQARRRALNSGPKLHTSGGGQGPRAAGPPGSPSAPGPHPTGRAGPSPGRSTAPSAPPHHHHPRGGHWPSRCSRWGWAEAPSASLYRRSGSWRRCLGPGNSSRPTRKPTDGQAPPPPHPRSAGTAARPRTSALLATAAGCHWLRGATAREGRRWRTGSGFLPSTLTLCHRFYGTGLAPPVQHRRLQKHRLSYISTDILLFSNIKTRSCRILPHKISSPDLSKSNNHENTWNKSILYLFIFRVMNASFFSFFVPPYRGYWGPNMSLGFTHWSNWSDVRNPSFRAASFNVVPSLCAVLAILAALSYPVTKQNEQVSRLQFQKICQRWEKSGTFGVQRINLLDAAITA